MSCPVRVWYENGCQGQHWWVRVWGMWRMWYGRLRKRSEEDMKKNEGVQEGVRSEFVGETWSILSYASPFTFLDHLRRKDCSGDFTFVLSNFPYPQSQSTLCNVIISLVPRPSSKEERRLGLKGGLGTRLCYPLLFIHLSISAHISQWFPVL